MKKVCLILLRTFGDVVMLNTLAETVKTYYGGEQCELSVVVDKEWGEIVKKNPYIDILYADDQYHQNNHLLQNIILSTHFDEVLMAQQLNGDDNLWHQFPETRNQHLFDYYLQRCRIPKDHKDVVREVRMWADGHDRISMNEKLVEFHHEKGLRVADGVCRKLVAFHTTSRNPQKDIKPAQWRDIINHFSEKHQFCFVQVGSGADLMPAFGENDKGKSHYLDMRGKLSFNELLYFFRDNCDLFIGLDSGMSFVAAASKKPTMLFYGCTIPLTSGPWGDNVTTFVSPECGIAKQRQWRCHNQCGSSPGCMDLLTSETIIRFMTERLITA